MRRIAVSLLPIPCQTRKAEKGNKAMKLDPSCHVSRTTLTAASVSGNESCTSVHRDRRQTRRWFRAGVRQDRTNPSSGGLCDRTLWIGTVALDAAVGDRADRAAEFLQPSAKRPIRDKTLIDYFLPIPIRGQVVEGRLKGGPGCASRPAQWAGRPDDPEMGLLGRADHPISRRQIPPVCQPLGPFHGAQGMDEFRGGACRERRRDRPV